VAKAAPELTVVRVAAPKVEVEPVVTEVAPQPEVLKEKKEEPGAAPAKAPEKK
jgi:hypothetical protein